MADTLGDFLIKLGWDFDEAKQKRFVEAMRAAELQAQLLAVAIEDLAKKSWATVIATSEAFDSLYYSSKRIGTSAGFITDFAYAVGQLGGSGDKAKASLEALGELLRRNPANLGYAKLAGIDINSTTKELEFNSEKWKEFHARPPWQRQQIEDKAGFDPLTSRAVEDDKLFKLMAEAKKRRDDLGFNPDTAAKDSNSLMTAWRTTSDELVKIWDKLYTGASKALTEPLKEFNTFLEAHNVEIGQAIDKISAALLAMTSAWVKDFKDIVADPTKMDKFTQAIQGFANGVKSAADNMDRLIADLKAINDVGDKAAGFLNQFLPGGGGHEYTPQELKKQGAVKGFFGDLWSTMTAPFSAGFWGGGGASGSNAPDGSQGKPFHVKPADTGGNSMWDWLFGKGGGVGGGAGSIGGGFGGGSGGGGGGGGGGDADGAGVSTPLLKGGASRVFNAGQSSTAAYLMDRLIKVHHWTPAAAAIAAGNMIAESGGSTTASGDHGSAHGLFQWRDARWAGVQGLAGTRGVSSSDRDAQIDYFANETQHRSMLERNWKNEPDLTNSGILGKAFEQYAGGIQGHRTTYAQEALRLYNESVNSSKFSVTEAPSGPSGVHLSEKGEFVKGNWVPKGFNTDPRIYLPNGGGIVSSDQLPSEYRGGAPDPKGWKGVVEDNEAGTKSIMKREAPIPVIPAPKLSPYGTLTNPFGAKPLGPTSMNTSTHHINMPQVTNITIDGANEPHTVASMVASNQSRVAADMAFNLKGATS